MNGLTNEQEAALAFLTMRRNVDIPNFDDNERPAAPFIALRDAGMIDMTTDWGQTLVVFHGLMPLGIQHYQQARNERRAFVTLTDSADELLGVIVANADLEKDREGGSLFDVDDGRIDDFRELKQNGLLSVMWADNKPYHYELTSKARLYIEGSFPRQEEKVQVINNNNNYLTANAESNAQASATVSATFSDTVAKILGMDIDDEIKGAAGAAVKALDEAAKSKDASSFAEKLEKVASIVKSTSSLAEVVMPFISTAIKTLMT